MHHEVASTAPEGRQVSEGSVIGVYRTVLATSKKIS